jgi:hypothetical protein
LRLVGSVVDGAHVDVGSMEKGDLPV